MLIVLPHTGLTVFAEGADGFLGQLAADALPAEADAGGGGQSANTAALPAGSGTDGKFVVAIDPGHGGVDVGAEGLGFNEEELTWKTANDLLALLEADDRFAPMLTKARDETYKPSERAAIANAAGAGLIFSIHGNSDPEYGSEGFECYPVPPGGGAHDESLRLARILTQKFTAAGGILHGENGIRYCYYDANNNKVIVESSDDSVHNDPTFTVLESGIPSILVEQCFITNQHDVNAFGDDAGCRAAAQVYYDTICEWLFA